MHQYRVTFTCEDMKGSGSHIIDADSEQEAKQFLMEYFQSFWGNYPYPLPTIIDAKSITSAQMPKE